MPEINGSNDSIEDAVAEGQNEVQEEIRNQLAHLARRRRCRITEFSRRKPTVWQPHEVINPETGAPFLEEQAWNLIANLLEAGHPIREIELDHPPGRKGYVMKKNLSNEQPILYIKLQLGSGKIIGRSFHYDRQTI